MRKFTVYPSSYVKATSDTYEEKIVWTSKDGNWEAAEVDLGMGKPSYTIYKNGKQFKAGLGSLYEAMRLANVYARGSKRVKAETEVDSDVTADTTIEADAYTEYQLTRRSR